MMYSDDEKIRDYKQYIPIENLVTNLIDRIIRARIEGDLKQYEIGIECLISLLHPSDEEKALQYKLDHDICFDITPAGVNKYYDLFNFIKREFTEDNIIWKRSRGYERGHD